MVTFEELAKKFAEKAAEEYGIYDVDTWLEKYTVKWFETQHALMKLMNLEEESIDDIAEFLNKVVGTLCLEAVGVKIKENEHVKLFNAVNKNYSKIADIEKLISNVDSHIDTATEKVIKSLNEKPDCDNNKMDKLIEMIEQQNGNFKDIKDFQEKEQEKALSLLEKIINDYNKVLSEKEAEIEKYNERLEKVNNSTFGTRLKYLFGKVKF